MKHLRTLLFSLLALLFVFSCEEEEEDPAPENYFVTKKDGVKWEAESAPSISIYSIKGYENLDSLTIVGHRAEGNVSLQIAFKGVGTYPIPSNGTAKYDDLEGGEITVSYYAHGNNGQQGQVVITEWNPDTKAIRGTFQFTAKLENYGNRPLDPNAPETLSFTEGEFQGTLKNVTFD
ncbi:hypothetical protein EFA69_08805 [Rufibacter immobilis]|uniref:Lipoprotein n=1 Tax=Rufibacter immobilis TaxID=1348778 RepID=A0A3M9MY11_9BACT|nr:DUF6252 family protein [Rufibacter immobilis]RNI29648.1 hypothetical protein EFA69_08805 [Rufibacter immobilis]